MASLTVVMLIQFIVSIFIVHINRMLSAVFSVQKNLSNVVYQKYVIKISNKVIFLRCDSAYMYSCDDTGEMQCI